MPPTPHTTSRLIAGCMTGTSIDSLDASLVRIHGTGLSIKAEPVRTITRPLGDLGPALRRIAEQQAVTAAQVAAISRDFSLLHLDALQDLLASDRADLIAVHGQTVFHAPPVSWQLLTPSVIARGLGTPVVFDLRAADLAAGGEGAPITPIADHVLFGSGFAGTTAVVNLGGFCNLTLLHAGGVEQVRGMDVCACNHILDHIARTLFHVPFDEDGRRAAAGLVHDEARLALASILLKQSSARRSLGTGDEVDEWLGKWSMVPPRDLAASACDALAATIAAAIGQADRILLAGGGAKNATLVRALEARFPVRPQSTAAFGIPPDYREAIAMAILGALCQDRIPITLPAITRVPSPPPISGCWVLP